MDGYCNFCNGLSGLLHKLDTRDSIRIFNLHSDWTKRYFQQNFPENPLSDFGNSLLVVDNGVIYSRSDAVLRIIRHLPGYWKMLLIFHLVPGFIRNGVYSMVAKIRYRWFGKRNECIIT
jgi:predicted DCC family thiol-disulfide oxidoreductase YuxK